MNLIAVIIIAALAFGLVCLDAYLTRRKAERQRRRFLSIVSKGETK